MNRLTHFDGIARSPTISPDGLTIAFELNRETSSGIYSISADGSNFMPLIEDGGDYKTPAFSPDGRFIAFASKQPPLGTFGIYVMNLQTGEFWLVGGIHLVTTSRPSGGHTSSHARLVLRAVPSKRRGIRSGGQRNTNSIPAIRGRIGPRMSCHRAVVNNRSPPIRRPSPKQLYSG